MTHPLKKLDIKLSSRKRKKNRYEVVEECTWHGPYRAPKSKPARWPVGKQRHCSRDTAIRRYYESNETKPPEHIHPHRQALENQIRSTAGTFLAPQTSRSGRPGHSSNKASSSQHGMPRVLWAGLGLAPLLVRCGKLAPRRFRPASLVLFGCARNQCPRFPKKESRIHEALNEICLQNFFRNGCNFSRRI